MSDSSKVTNLNKAQSQPRRNKHEDSSLIAPPKIYLLSAKMPYRSRIFVSLLAVLAQLA